jgi:hypothetical protein
MRRGILVFMISTADRFRIRLDLMTGMTGALGPWLKENPDGARRELPGNGRGATALHVAVQHGQHNLAAWLIERGADVNAIMAPEAASESNLGDGGKPEGSTPMVIAAGLRSSPLVRVLLRSGADPWLKQAAWLAAFFGDLPFLKTLKEELGAKFVPYVWPADGGRPSTDMVLAAIQGNKWETAEWLVSEGHSPHRPPSDWGNDENARQLWQETLSSVQARALDLGVKEIKKAKNKKRL